MLFLYLSGVLLWLVYGIRVHAVAVIWANALAVVMVLISIILKANPPAKKLEARSRVAGSRDFGSSRLRIAVDMDEVIADSFGKQLNCYNQRTGAKLTTEMVSSKGLASLIPHDRWEEFAGIPHEDGFFADLELIEGSREALLELSRQSRCIHRQRRHGSSFLIRRKVRVVAEELSFYSHQPDCVLRGQEHHQCRCPGG